MLYIRKYWLKIFQSEDIVGSLLDLFLNKSSLFKINNKGNKAIIQRFLEQRATTCASTAYTKPSPAIYKLFPYFLPSYFFFIVLHTVWMGDSRFLPALFGMGKRMKNDFTNCACQWFSNSCKILSFSLYCWVNWKSERRVM